MNTTLKNLVAMVSLTVMSAAAMAQTAPVEPDYSSIGAAVSVGAAVTAIVAMGVAKVGPNVAKWVTNKLANFFR